MAIPRLNDDMNIIQKLDDRPNDVGGLTAAGLKAKFDEGIGVIKDWLNNTLLPYLEGGNAANQLGVDTIPGLSATTVQEALEEIMGNIQIASVENLVDGSVTTDKLADLAVTEGKIDNLAVTEGKIADSAVTTNKIDNLAVTTAKIALLAITTGLLADLAVTTEKLDNGAVTTDKLAPFAVDNTKLALDAVTKNKIKDGEVTLDKLANNSVDRYKIKDGEVTPSKLSQTAGAQAVTTATIRDGAVTFSKLANFKVFTIGSGTAADFAVSQNSGGVVLLSGVNSGYGIVSLGRAASTARGKLMVGAGLSVDDHTTDGGIPTNEVLISNTVSTPTYAVLIVLNGTISVS